MTNDDDMKMGEIVRDQLQKRAARIREQDVAIAELVEALQTTASMLLALAKTYGATRENWFSRDDDPSHEPIFLGEALDKADALIAKHSPSHPGTGGQPMK